LIFAAIPNLRILDDYWFLLEETLPTLQNQTIYDKVSRVYITPPFDGVFLKGEKSGLEAYVERMNHIVEEYLKTGLPYLFIQDGDVELPPNCLETLIAHDVDVCSGVYPFKDFEDRHYMCFSRQSKTDPCGRMIPNDWKTMKGKILGINERVSGGTGCLLVKRHVFEDGLRFDRKNDCGMDMLFWKRVQDKGHSAIVDTNIVCGHLPNWSMSRLRESGEI